MWECWKRESVSVIKVWLPHQKQAGNDIDLVCLSVFEMAMCATEILHDIPRNKSTTICEGDCLLPMVGLGVLKKVNMSSVGGVDLL